MDREDIVEDYLNEEISDSQLSKEQLFSRNTGLVYFIIKTYYRHEHRFEYDDLVQMGMVGLWKACLRYDSSKGVKFSSFACKQIWGNISAQLRDSGLFMGNKESRARRENSIGLLSYFVDKESDNIKGTGQTTTEDVVEAIIHNATISTMDDMDRADLYNDMERAFAVLDPVSVDIFRRCKLGTETQTQLSERLNMSQANVSRKVNYVKRCLREILKEYKYSY